MKDSLTYIIKRLILTKYEYQFNSKKRTNVKSLYNSSSLSSFNIKSLHLTSPPNKRDFTSALNNIDSKVNSLRNKIYNNHFGHFGHFSLEKSGSIFDELNLNNSLNHSNFVCSYSGNKYGMNCSFDRNSMNNSYLFSNYSPKIRKKVVDFKPSRINSSNFSRSRINPTNYKKTKYVPSNYDETTKILITNINDDSKLIYDTNTFVTNITNSNISNNHKEEIRKKIEFLMKKKREKIGKEMKEIIEKKGGKKSKKMRLEDRPPFEV